MNLQDVKERIEDADNYSIVYLGFDIIELAGDFQGLETFDRLIVAMTKHLGVPILTSDEVIHEKSGLKVISD